MVLTVHPVEGAAEVVPARRRWRVRFVGAESSSAGADHSIDLSEAPVAEGLAAHLPEGSDLGSNEPVRRIHELLIAAQCAHTAKNFVSELVAAEGPLDQLVALREARVRGIVHGEAAPLPEDLVEAVSEIIVADPGR